MIIKVMRRIQIIDYSGKSTFLALLLLVLKNAIITQAFNAEIAQAFGNAARCRDNSHIGFECLPPGYDCFRTKTTCGKSTRVMSSRIMARRKTVSVEEEKEIDKLKNDQTWKERAKRWVVIVDDEESIRLAVGEFLYDQGYQVTACADADALLDVILNSKGAPPTHEKSSNNGDVALLPAVPDIIISDIRMPGKDGLQLTELLRSSERLRRVPIVLLTAKSMTQDRIAGYKAGADVYLTKPFSPEELLSIIDNAIQRKQQMAGRNGKLVELAQDVSDVKRFLELQKGVVKPHQRSTVNLTQKEAQVLDLLSRGYTNAEIAAERGNASTTAIHRTIQTLYRKTGAKTRTELVRWAIQTGNVAKPKR